jgi:ATP-binding cassette, subfamily B, bacterial
VVEADRICVIEAGRLVADGPHGELMRSSPLYQRLAELQFGQGNAPSSPSAHPVPD